MSLVNKVISIILKIVVVVSATLGTIFSVTASAETSVGGETAFMYFTIQSNILIALICLIGIFLIITNRIDNKVWHVIKLVGTVAITLTGFVFCFIIAPLMETGAWMIHNILTHVVVPLAAIADYIAVCSVLRIKRINVLWVDVPPLLYGIYAIIGYIRGWEFLDGNNYPYYFLNWGTEAGAFGVSSKQPFLGTVWWILILLGFVIFIGLFYLWIADKIRKSKNNKV